MAWHVTDHKGRVAGIGETEKEAWRVAEEYTDHEVRDLLDAGYSARFVSASATRRDRIARYAVVALGLVVALTFWQVAVKGGVFSKPERIGELSHQ